MEHLNEYFIIKNIFKHLNNDDIKNLLLITKNYHKQFKINNESYPKTGTFNNIILNHKLKNYYNKQIHNYNKMHLSLITYKTLKINDNNIRKIMKTLNNELYNNISHIIFNKITLNNFNDYVNLIKNFKNLEIITFDHVYAHDLYLNDLINDIHENITTVNINNASIDILKMFDTNINSLNKIKILDTYIMDNTFNNVIFNSILNKNKNIKHIILEGNGTLSYFNSYIFPFIEKLEVETLNCGISYGIQRLKIIETNKNTLKEVRINKLPYDFDGGYILKYILEEMCLETFYYQNYPLILQSEKQNIVEIVLTENYISCIYELFKQFPTIKKLKLYINWPYAEDCDYNYLINFIISSPNVFENLEIIEIENKRMCDTHYLPYIAAFSRFYKNIYNVKKIKIITDDVILLNYILINWFVNNCNEHGENRLTNLTELEIITRFGNRYLNERCRIIKNNIPNLKKLSMRCDDNEYITIYNIFIDTMVDIIKL